MTVAVAMALYNGAKFIEEQLDCIRLQSQKVDRVVMCDDGSKDDTVNIVKKYIEKYDLAETWSLHINEQNLGYIKNFYKAMTLCEEDLIFLADQDDIWELDKIENMTQIMKVWPEINLLSSKYGIIDSEGGRIKSILHKETKESKEIYPIAVKDIMTAYNWPGMVMCVRNTFFGEIYKDVANYKIPHDLAFAICAADKNSFYEYDYVSAYHRRHDNNTAKEEHRILKLLDMERKLKDIQDTCQSLEGLVDAKLPIDKDSYDIIEYKLNHLYQREKYLQEKSISGIIGLYGNPFSSFF